MRRVSTPFDRSRFSKGTKGARGLCGAAGCIRNAVTYDGRIGRCEIHPAAGVNVLTTTVLPSALPVGRSHVPMVERVKVWREVCGP